MKLLRKTYPSTNPVAKQPNAVVKRDLDNAYIDIGNVVNGQLHFGSPPSVPVTQKVFQNVNGFWFEGTTPSTPDAEFQVSHNLGRVPTGWGPMSIDQAGILYRSTTTWTESTAFLKCNVASANVKIFLT